MLPVYISKRFEKWAFTKKSDDDQRSFELESNKTLYRSQGPISSGFAATENATGALKKNKDQKNHELTHTVSHEGLDSDDVRLLDKDIDFPDGGLQAYLVVFGSFMGLLPVFGMINSLGAIESYISRNQLAAVPSSVISWIFSIYLSISSLSCIFAGGYFDRNGRTAPMCIGSLFFVGGLMATANCQTVWQFILGFSILCGMGTGITMTPLVSCVATWFFKKRAMATSIATIGGSVGGIVLPLLLRKLYEEVGFQWALRITAFICSLCLACATILAREREKPVAQPFESYKKLFLWYLTSSFNWRYFFEWRFLFAALGGSLAESSLTASSTYIASYSMARNNTETVSYALITTTNAVGILGRYIPGYLADKFTGRFNMMIITMSMAVFFNLVMWLPFGGNLKVLWAYSMLYGFSSGTVLSLTAVCIGQISKTADFGKRYATMYLIQAITTLPIIPISGALIGDGKIKGYNNFIIFTSMLMLAGVICFVISRSLCVGPKISKF